MRAYIFGAGASKCAGYPLASQLLQELSAWLDRSDSSVHWVPRARNRMEQVRETFGSLDDFEGILGKLEEYGYQRVRPTGPTTYSQDAKDILHDCMEPMQGINCGDPNVPAQGFYPQYLRSDLISAFREYFYDIEEHRSEPTVYESLAGRLAAESTIITFNYDLALERAFRKAGRWDVGSGYGYLAFSGRPISATTIFKLHGSVNWFKGPIQGAPPPVIFSRDMKLLGYEDVADPRIGANGVSVDNEGTFILPDPKKKFYWEAFWLPLWNAAAERLCHADEIYIHGYSMPDADSQAQKLLFENVSKPAAIEIYCLSTSDSIAQEFQKRGFTHVASYPAIRFEEWATA